MRHQHGDANTDRFNFDTLSHTDLTRKTGMTGDINLETLYWANYDLIVIDESHNFRNNARGKENDKGVQVRVSGKIRSFRSRGCQYQRRTA